MIMGNHDIQLMSEYVCSAMIEMDDSEAVCARDFVNFFFWPQGVFLTSLFVAPCFNVQDRDVLHNFS